MATYLGDGNNYGTEIGTMYSAGFYNMGGAAGAKGSSLRSKVRPAGL